MITVLDQPRRPLPRPPAEPSKPARVAPCSLAALRTREPGQTGCASRGAGGRRTCRRRFGSAPSDRPADGDGPSGRRAMHSAPPMRGMAGGFRCHERRHICRCISPLVTADAKRTCLTLSRSTRARTTRRMESSPRLLHARGPGALAPAARDETAIRKGRPRDREQREMRAPSKLHERGEAPVPEPTPSFDTTNRIGRGP